MKKAVLFLSVCLFIVSCEKKEVAFKGLEGFNIGENFESLPASKHFRNVMEGEYFIETFHLSDAIGTVSDLNISTENGKIGEVKFWNTETTNIAELEKVFKILHEEKVETSVLEGIGLENLDMRFFKTQDSTIYFSVFQRNGKFLKNGKPQYEYSYIHKDMVAKNNERTMKMIGQK